MKTVLHGAPPITVLQSLSPPNGTTRFVNQIVDGAHPKVDVRFFSWRYALTGRYDVFHVHWPEFIIRDKRPLKAVLLRGALRALLLRTRVQRIPIIRTAHNLQPHEIGHSAEARALDALDKRTTVFIRLNSTTPIEPESKAVTILHGHYRDRFGGMAPAEPIRGRILYFGLIRPYKGVESLLAVFRSLPRADLELRIVGRPSSGLGAVVETAQSKDDRISSRLEFVSDEDLVGEVGRSELVVLPYREMHNSGSMLVALSLDRPVLVPRSASNKAIAKEVGAGWIYMYDGELTREILEATIQALRATDRDTRPHLEGRDWKTLGALTYETYLDALQSTGRLSGMER